MVLCHAPFLAKMGIKVLNFCGSAGKTFEMQVAEMEIRRLGLSQ